MTLAAGVTQVLPTAHRRRASSAVVSRAVRLRVAAEGVSRARTARSSRSARGADKPPPLPLDEAATQRFSALKAWRAEVAREHNLPAYIVFHDATLAEMARECPATLEALAGVGGVGARKLEAYGEQILRVIAHPDR